MGRVTRQRQTIRGYHDEAAAPAIHAGFRKGSVVIRLYKYNLHFAVQSLARSSGYDAGAFHLSRCGEKGYSIPKGPPKILSIRKLEAIHAKLFRQGHHVRNAIEVHSVEDNIQRERNVQFFCPAGHSQLTIEARKPGDPIGLGATNILNRNLDTIEAALR